jgi:hypothetical protein
VIVCYDHNNSLPTCRWTDRRQIAPDFPNPIFSALVGLKKQGVGADKYLLIP